MLPQIAVSPSEHDHDHVRRVALPGLTGGAVGHSTPEVDDRFAVDAQIQEAPELVALNEVPLELLPRRFERGSQLPSPVLPFGLTHGSPPGLYLRVTYTA
jgi:hypothetical protein